MSPSVLRPLFALLALSAAVPADTLYVDADLVTGADDGTSWADAFQGSSGLQVALGASVSGDRVFVKTGTYRPAPGLNRSQSFSLINGVEIFGSFLGTESEPEERPPLDSAPSILSGDLAGDDGSNLFGDNSYHIVRTAGTNATAVLDGFHVVSGAATGGGTNEDRGGGILCISNVSPTIRGCRFLSNRSTFGGGAGYINNSSPTFVDCTFEDGDGGSFGGAFDIANSDDVVFERCLFSNNIAARGGGLEIFNSDDILVSNCVFIDNEATGATTGGGGLWIGTNGNTEVRHCTIVDNVASAQFVGGLRVQSSPLTTIVGCVFWGNEGPGGAGGAGHQVNGGANVTYSIVEGGQTGIGNLSSDPLFRDSGAGDYTLLPGSPAIDAGENASVPIGVLTDFGGGSRFVDDPGTPDTGVGTAPIVDMGAFEYGSGLANETVRVGTPANPSAFLPGQTSAPNVGAVWDPVVDHTTFVTDSVADFALITGSPFELLLGAEGTLLCNVVDPIVEFASAPAPGVPFAIGVPNKLPLVGLTLCAQGGSLDSGFAPHLANAIDFTIGG